jgi:hypothetical protein
MDTNTDTANLTFAEKISYITETLNALGYQIISYDEPNAVSLSGYDSALNYIELLDLDIFTVNAAVDWVTSVWMARAMALTAAVGDVQQRIATLTDSERATLYAGVMEAVETQRLAEASEESEGNETPA